jgi:hypothetical protein
MKGETFIAAFLVVVLFVVVIYDTIAIMSGGRYNTVSSVVMDWSETYPIIPLAAGILLGHLFWPQRFK